MSKKINGFLDDQNMEEFDLILANIEKLSRDMNGLLSADNVASATATLSNFSKTSEDMKGMISRFEKTADEIDKAVSSITEIIANNEASLNRFSRDGLEQAIGTLQETRKMAESIRKIADKLNQDPSQLIYKQPSHGVEIPQ